MVPQNRILIAHTLNIKQAYTYNVINKKNYKVINKNLSKIIKLIFVKIKNRIKNKSYYSNNVYVNRYK